jgi:hypothetical protein
MYLSSLRTVLHAHPTQTLSLLFPEAQLPKLGPAGLTVEVSKYISLSLTHSLTHSHSHTHTHSLTDTHWHTHTRAHPRTHARTHTAGRTPLSEWSDRRRGRYLQKYKKHKRRPSTPSAWHEPSIPANKRPQTYALECMASEISFPFRYFALTTENRPACIRAQYGAGSGVFW